MTEDKGVSEKCYGTILALDPVVLWHALARLVPWEIALALAIAPDAVRSKVYESLPAPSERPIIEALRERLGRIRVDDVDFAAQRFLNAIDAAQAQCVNLRDAAAGK